MEVDESDENTVEAVQSRVETAKLELTNDIIEFIRTDETVSFNMEFQKFDVKRLK